MLAVAGAAYAFFYSEIGTQSVKVATIDQEIATKTKAASSEAVAKSELNSLTSEEAAINQYFISTNDVVPFLEQLQKTGKYFGANVTVQSVSATPGTPYGQLGLALTITGTFDAVLRTIGAIEYGPYDTTVSTLNFATTANGVASSSPTWIANTTFIVGAQTGSTTPSS